MKHYLDFPCDDCGAKVNEPCKRAMHPHKSRRDARDKARAGESAKFSIEPQRDFYEGKGTPYDASETWFVACEEDDAELWAVFDVSGPDPEWVEDYPTRAAAEKSIAA